MVDNFNTKNDEVELIEILKDIWSGRLKIILITIIAILVGVGYIYIKPTLFKNSLTIKSIDPAKFTKINSAYEIFNIYENESAIKNESIILKKFIDEFIDYNELLITFKNNGIIKNDISKLFIVNKLNNNEYILNFFWHDTEEAKNILNQTLNLTLDNFKKLLHQELIDLWEIEKIKILNRDLLKINLLLEQSLIAKEINLEVGNIDQIINIFDSSYIDNDYFFDSSYIDNDYFQDRYLRGFKVIDKEIELLKKRDYTKFINIEENIENINDTEAELIDYNILMIDVQPLKNSKLILAISATLGLLLSIFYVLLHAALQKKNR